MSVTGSASSTSNLNVLKGKISSLSPYAVDKTLSVEGAAADAKAVGDALEKKLETNDVADDLTTSDSKKALSAKQGTVLKKSVDDLRDNTVNMGHTLTNMSNSLKNAQDSAESAQTEAEKKIDPDGSVAMTADFDMGGNVVKNVAVPVDNTDATNKEYVDAKTFYCEVTLNKDNWATTTGNAPYTQTVELEKILPTDKPHYCVIYSSSIDTKKAEKEAFALVDDLDTADGKVTFTCFDEKPGVNMTIQLEVNR